MICTGLSGFDRGRRMARPSSSPDVWTRALSPLREAPVAALLLLLVLSSGLFMLFPELDLAASAMFAVPGQGFPLARDETLLAIRDLNRALPAWIAVTLLLLLLARGAFGARRFLPAPHALLHVLAVYVVACLGIVHTLKNTIGRARPEHIEAFGGEAVFTLPWQLSDACQSNCSFSSGEAASAMAMMALAFLAPRGWRALGALALAGPAFVFSVNRIAFGSHFASDVVVSWLVVAITILALRVPMKRHAARIDAAVDGQWREPLLEAVARGRKLAPRMLSRVRMLFLRAAA